MSRHKLHPAPPPRCVHVYSQGWSCPRPVERDGLCRVHGSHLSSVGPVSVCDVDVAEELPPNDNECDSLVESAERLVPESSTTTRDERAAIALLALYVERSEAPEVEGVPLEHAVALARQFLKRTRGAP